eukprot:2267524-Pyramimonas_sp.AAC.1
MGGARCRARRPRGASPPPLSTRVAETQPAAVSRVGGCLHLGGAEVSWRASDESRGAGCTFRPPHHVNPSLTYRPVTPKLSMTPQPRPDEGSHRHAKPQPSAGAPSRRRSRTAASA